MEGEKKGSEVGVWGEGGRGGKLLTTNTSCDYCVLTEHQLAQRTLIDNLRLSLSLHISNCVWGGVGGRGVQERAQIPDGRGESTMTGGNTAV